MKDRSLGKLGMTKKSIWQTSIFLLPVVILAIISWIRWANYPLFEVLGCEDGFFEYWQAGFLMIACAFAFAIAWKLNRACKFIALIYFVLAICFFFVAMEEVSWAQRIFGHETSGIFAEYNVQQETTFHNFSLIQNNIGIVYLGVMVYGMFGWVVCRVVRLLFKGRSKCQISSLVSALRAPLGMTGLFVFPWYLMLYFHRLWINLDFPNYAPQDFEVAEFLLYLGMLIFVINNYLKIRNKIPRLRSG